MAEYRKLFENYVPHPSIVIYVLSNELPYEGKRGAEWHEFLTKAHAVLKKEFPVPFIGNAGYGQGREGDINDVHRYWGWYYNSLLTYFNLRDPTLFGDPEGEEAAAHVQRVRRRVHGPERRSSTTSSASSSAPRSAGPATPRTRSSEAQAYQAFMFKHAAESFRTMRPTNPRLSGLMPFTILFRNWEGITSFEQMGHNANAEQMARSYSPVLLSWENWTPNVYAGTKLKAFAHVVNDAEDFSDLTGATLAYELRDAGREGDRGRTTLEAADGQVLRHVQHAGRDHAAATLPTGRYTVRGTISSGRQAGHARTRSRSSSRRATGARRPSAAGGRGRSSTTRPARRPTR